MLAGVLRRPTLATTTPDSHTPEPAGSRQGGELPAAAAADATPAEAVSADPLSPEPGGWAVRGRQLFSTVAALPIFTKVMVGNAGVVIFGAVVGTYVTTHTVRSESAGTPLELAFVFAAIGALLSVMVNWIVLKLALRPLDGITRTVEKVRKGNLRARVERDPFSDPQIETLRETMNAMLDRLDEHGARLRALSSQIINAQEEERLRISRELHDETAQALASLLVRQRVAERSPDPESLQRTMADLRVLTSEALEGVRRMALELRPTMLDDLGLVAAVEAFARQFSHRTGIPVDVRMTRRPERLPPDVELVAFRVIQEALSNVARHSGASRAEIRLGAGPSILTISIADDGRGFQLETALDSRQRSLGLFGMHERAGLVGGRLILDSAPGRGTRVRLELPTGE
ncbi:MAG: sensor histidine kinase [Chloroflexi bacterium]|nr:sensor histidine kinase [Chloroflexota bacterium]